MVNINAHRVDSTLRSEGVKIPVKGGQGEGLLEGAERKVKLKSKGGRPSIPEHAKANKKIIAYVNESQLNEFNQKRGRIPQSTVLTILIERYLKGEITL